MAEKKPPHAEGHYHYNSALRDYAHENRYRLTRPAILLWKYALSKRQMLGYQFRRERPIGWYIADFACLPLGLVIEVDGSSHDSLRSRRRDRERDRYLAELGFTTLRFTNGAVLHDLEGVKRRIRAWIEENAVVPPPRPREREKCREEE